MLKDEYIFQEMLEQKKIAALHKTLPRPNWPPVAEHIILTGSGDSHCAALFAQWVLAEKGKVSALPALEASQVARSLHSKDLLITISVSGRTARVLEAAQRALAQGAHVVAVTDNVNSPLAALASEIWPIYASPCEELFETKYIDENAKQYVGYHHDVAQTKTFWATLLTLIRAAAVRLDWQSLLSHTRCLLSPSFYEPLLNKGTLYAKSGQTFFLGSGWAKIIARFASYKMYEFNRIAHFTGIEEYCHTHYFITRPGDTVVFLITDDDVACRAVEVIPVLCKLFEARIIWLQSGPLNPQISPTISSYHLEVVKTPSTDRDWQLFFDLLLGVQWLTYSIGRIDAPNINTFHAGYDTERLVAGSLITVRKSTIRATRKRESGKGRKNSNSD